VSLLFGGGLAVLKLRSNDRELAIDRGPVFEVGGAFELPASEVGRPADNHFTIDLFDLKFGSLRCAYREIRHHVVFMLEIMAVHEVFASPVSKGDCHSDCFIGVNQDGVTQSMVNRLDIA